MRDEPIYRSSNGDDWLLRTDTKTGTTSVVHRPNLSSGGRESTMSVDEFLQRGGGGPEVQAVRAALEKAKG
ncbi:hypothetical protein [Aureimonas leprariae]|uniref:Uncharacterized protein n=1 Tax=Plantimonas leprariae TaxID=2615207 RepID=A0A7V7PR76_9HYPH|nr:hypothetical protein [Aureimonas leprariae]KAB0680910.1 hypothetical protein F6X38_07980 [Aureimonas leprariae]